eukprot:CAMPEP_0117002294 /NCGR_PEP_ID=MMETSP0472-20121206/4018_1 /TAXON_ID=693140 ORGANISM="Tiarina fusus, Strain LIS" /NCGR_SAMPLE_ID=MMETSP0472 /ASSEMBLY_ACC=CAM_ASM_000603 /LENGTH=138 /DNA_ID=CAMNT_0004702607 /DNA_START=1543 /DNA_END=1959 /DNA_ORIENTATION=-
MTIKQFHSSGHHDEDLYNLFDSVKLAYLPEKHGWNTSADWEAIISLSELQRLAVCRVLFHQPRFAILDKAMCMVDAGVELAIYQQAKDLGITFITVTEHQSLKNFHDSILTLKNDNSWEYVSESAQTQLSEDEEDEEW